MAINYIKTVLRKSIPSQSYRVSPAPQTVFFNYSRILLYLQPNYRVTFLINMVIEFDMYMSASLLFKELIMIILYA